MVGLVIKAFLQTMFFIIVPMIIILIIISALVIYFVVYFIGNLSAAIPILIVMSVPEGWIGILWGNYLIDKGWID